VNITWKDFKEVVEKKMKENGLTEEQMEFAEIVYIDIPGFASSAADLVVEVRRIENHPAALMVT
jgi:hypothetical protein